MASDEFSLDTEPLDEVVVIEEFCEESNEEEVEPFGLEDYLYEIWLCSEHRKGRKKAGEAGV